MALKQLLKVFVPAALLALGIFIYHYSWVKLNYYIPEAREFRSEFRTMAQHDSIMRDKEWPYILRVDSSLLYFGSWHTQNPDDPQIAEIERMWRAYQPTVALTENRQGFFIGGRRAGIRYFGEFGLLYCLAGESGVPIYSLEPSWETEVAEMKAAFPVEEVVLFYTLRVFLSERKNDMTPEKIDALAAHLLRKRGSRPGLKGTLPDLKAFDELWNERFSHIGNWRTMPAHEISPGKNPTRLQKLANLANEVRDRHAARVILEWMEKGERVFALAGGSHVVKQEPVLRDESKEIEDGL